jgi:exopolysaccharide biosynthesis polyprenyl glycosylphosphotransferase
MKILGKREPVLLLLGDLVIFIISLWAALSLRYLSLPEGSFFLTHLVPFSMLFVVWVIVFYIAGLYGKHTLILKTKLPSILLNALLINSLLAVTFFYFIPLFGITPKTILFIYLAVSFLLVLAWRFYVYPSLGSRRVEGAIIIGTGSEMQELFDEINGNNIYSIHFVSKHDLANVNDKGFWEEIAAQIKNGNVSTIVIDLENEKIGHMLADFYGLIFSQISFVDLHRLYEDIFDRVPLSLLRHNWFLENISTKPRHSYDLIKRVMDTILSVFIGLLTLILYPFVALAIKLDDGGPVFIAQERVGGGNKRFRIYKFRTMTDNDEGRYGEKGSTKLEVTKAGRFLRKSRIDELPQLWSVLKGDQSLIGPRPELPALVELYGKEIPYYNVRHIIKPGLSGWAQIHQDVGHPHHKEAVMETKEKLAYDLYYIKNRSFFLDIQIALLTIKTLLSRVGI